MGIGFDLSFSQQFAQSGKICYYDTETNSIVHLSGYRDLIDDSVWSIGGWDGFVPAIAQTAPFGYRSSRSLLVSFIS